MKPALKLFGEHLVISGAPRDSPSGTSKNQARIATMEDEDFKPDPGAAEDDEDDPYVPGADADEDEEMPEGRRRRRASSSSCRATTTTRSSTR